MNASSRSITAPRGNPLAVSATATLNPEPARQLELASASGTARPLVKARSEPELSLQELGSVITGLVTAINSTLNDEPESAKECLSRVAAILQPIRSPEAQSRAQIKGGLAAWQVRKVVSHIEANLDKPIMSSDLAALLSLSPCHFSRAFRNSLGDSPREYVIRRRIERAQGLMLSTDAPLSLIAAECGLDQAHFSRLFRKIVGESPRTWRRARVSPDRPDLLAGIP